MRLGVWEKFGNTRTASLMMYNGASNFSSNHSENDEKNSLKIHKTCKTWYNEEHGKLGSSEHGTSGLFLLYCCNYITHKHPDLNDDAFEQIKKKNHNKRCSHKNSRIEKLFFFDCTSVSCHSQTPLNLTETISFSNCLFWILYSPHSECVFVNTMSVCIWHPSMNKCSSNATNNE